MRARQLETEMRQAVACLSSEQIQWLVNLGVSALDIAVHHLIGSVRLLTWGKRRELWRPASPGERGITAFVVPIRVQHAGAPFATNPWQAIRFGDLIDLAAWHPLRPTDWLLRTGEAKWLGAAAPTVLDPFPIRVHQTPQAWLCARGEGLALLSRRPERQTEVLAYFAGRGLIATDRAHQAQLRRIADGQVVAERHPQTRITIHEPRLL